LEVADALRWDFRVHNAIGPAAEIDSGSGESFIHWHKEISGAQDTTLRTESLLDGFSEGDTDIFHGVMLIHVEIATGTHEQIKCSVTRDEFQHVVEEANACCDARFSAPVEIQLQTNVCFVRFAVNCGSA